jgi:hypothetical protein
LTRVSAQGTCDVCGRTLLVGEQVRTFVSVEGRHEVCSLCSDRTAELGWLPADEDGAEERLRAESERKPRFLAKLFARPERDASAERERETEPADGEREPDVDEMPPPAPDAPRLATHELETERYDVAAEWRGAEAEKAQAPPVPEAGRADLPAPPADAAPAPLPDPAGRGMRPRRLQADLSPTSRFERAIARFNSSDAGRTVTGLTRTLGAPSVSVGDLAGAADEVRVTVAWELTWYQWGVDLGDELRPVYELKKGYEVSEIDAPARQWNASAHDGRIVMVAPRRREAAAGRPVHR